MRRTAAGARGAGRGGDRSHDASMKAASSATPPVPPPARDRCCRAWWRRARGTSACASGRRPAPPGQEAYSIAILLDEMGLAREGWTIDLIATDLSAEAIARAERGRYAALRDRARPGCAHAMRCFRRDGTEWVVDASLRRMVTFPPLQPAGQFRLAGRSGSGLLPQCADVFRRAPRGRTCWTRMADTMAPDGVLVLGENEMPGRDGFVARR